jgi:hypothetical protein
MRLFSIVKGPRDTVQGPASPFRVPRPQKSCIVLGSARNASHVLTPHTPDGRRRLAVPAGAVSHACLSVGCFSCPGASVDADQKGAPPKTLPAHARLPG